jgi:Beta-galactosidase/beta-glucuronidase
MKYFNEYLKMKNKGGTAMQIHDLGGKWELYVPEDNVRIAGNLPGSNYLDLIANKRIEDPFLEMNEETTFSVAEKDYVYTRTFTPDSEMLRRSYIELVAQGVDTLSEISINGKKVASTDNTHRTYRFSVKELLQSGENEISIYFKSPMQFIRACNNKKALKGMGMGVPGTSYIRKPACHFGWDWGPRLPLAGISGGIWLEGYDTARLSDVIVKQTHISGSAEVLVTAEIKKPAEDKTSYDIRVRLTDPDGNVLKQEVRTQNAQAKVKISIENPMLWWCNGLGEQPLYQLDVELYDSPAGNRATDTCHKKIGLRTIELNTEPDRWGKNFQFRINGVPVFAKGASWIPSDSFITRTERDTLEFYIKSAKLSNMNMLRVWAGGYYGSDEFYDLCDEYGILVWQDFLFACMEYPLDDPAFLKNVKQEVTDNVCRLRHHASLALWCGNNEIQLSKMSWPKRGAARKLHENFFSHTLYEWVSNLDSTTPYWPGSPNSDKPEEPANALGKGDTHLWQVWHGMMPLESFRRYPTRFCSEFGIESLPDIRTIQSFTGESSYSLFDPVMMAHQKSGGGNQKMLFYILSRYRNPAGFEDFIYLSQLIQSKTIQTATEAWRRNKGRCNGALYWQYNDCWPVISWAGIDYGRRYKAVQYRAKQFNEMLAVSVDSYKGHADVYVVNDRRESFSGTLRCTFTDFGGNVLSENVSEVTIRSCWAEKICCLPHKNYLKGCATANALLVLDLVDASGSSVFHKTHLLVPDKKCKLEKPHIKTSLEVRDGTGYLNLQSDTFARYVYIEIDGTAEPLSDNFFDLECGKSKTVAFRVSDSFAENTSRIRIKTLADVETKSSPLNDRRLRLAMRLKKQNLISWVICKLFL